MYDDFVKVIYGCKKLAGIPGNLLSLHVLVTVVKVFTVLSVKMYRTTVLCPKINLNVNLLLQIRIRSTPLYEK